MMMTFSLASMVPRPLRRLEVAEGTARRHCSR